MVNGKAKLVRENFCDGLGDCLPNCPTGAITFEERKAPAYDDEAVINAQEKIRKAALNMTKEEIMQIKDENERRKLMTAKIKEDTGKNVAHMGCPGSKVMQLHRETETDVKNTANTSEQVSRLQNWPVQIKLAPTKATYFNGAKLLIAADCTSYSYASFHQDFMRGKVTIIGCPKLDSTDYSEKLTEIIAQNDIKSVTIVRMEVPCCGGIEMAAKKALQQSGKFIPWQVVTISTDGKILD